MLTSIRNTSNTLFVKLLFVLLIASFAVWGIGDVLRTSPGDGPITVGERQITLSEINREFRLLLDRQGQAFGVRLSEQQGMQIGLLDQAISNLVSKATIDNLAADAGLRIDDDTISSYIRDVMGYKTADGQFDRAAFEQFMQSQGLSEQVFVEQLRLDIAREELLNILVGGVRTPEPIAATLRAYREETRVADFVRVDAAAMDAPAAPSDADLATYYQANGDAYMAPEMRSAAVVLLDPEQLAADVVVDDEQINEEYLYQRDSLFVPEQRTIEQMILADAAQAEAAAGALQEGRDFATVAAEIAGQDPASLVVGDFGQAEWFVPEVEDALFAGDAGAVSDAVETPLGWRIYRVSAIEEAHEPSLDEVRDRLAQDVALRVANDTLFDVSGQFQDELAGGATLAEAAETLDLTVETFGPLGADGQDRDGDAVTVPGGFPVVTAVFEEQPGIVSAMKNLPNGGLFFVEVDQVIPPALLPLDDVREQVVADWTADQKLESARALAQSIQDDLAVGTPLADLAAANGLDLRTAEGVRRDGNETGGLPGTLAADLFAMDVGGVASEESEGEPAVFVAQLREVVPAPEDPEAFETLWLQTSAQATNDIFIALGTALQQRHVPEVRDEFIRQQFNATYGG